MPFEDESIPGWEKLPRIYKRYLKGLSEGTAHMGTEDVVRHVELLLFPNSTLSKVESLQEQLKSYEVNPISARNTKVKMGWKVLGKFVERHESVLRDSNVVLFICGSMFYDDPRNLDLDGSFVTEKVNRRFERIYQGTLSNEFEDSFRSEVGGAGSDVQYVSFSTLASYCQKIQDGDEEFVFENRELIESEFAIASEILTGYPIYGSPKTVEQMREKVRLLMGKNPLLATEICMTLEETLKIREERRGLS